MRQIQCQIVQARCVWQKYYETDRVGTDPLDPLEKQLNSNSENERSQSILNGETALI